MTITYWMKEGDNYYILTSTYYKGSLSEKNRL